jgi:hypothetical protein
VPGRGPVAGLLATLSALAAGAAGGRDGIRPRPGLILDAP